MKKTTVKIIALIFTLILLAAYTTIAYAENNSHKIGDVIQFGSYPQSEVKDETLIAELNSLAPEWDDWKNYGYYSGDNKLNSMVQGDWMRYTDVVYGEAKYRGVKFIEYRPTYTYSAHRNTNQKMNGYYTGTIYWFRFEPVRWRIIDPKLGLVMSESIIDSQAFSDTVYYTGGVLSQAYNDSEKTIPANDYETSSIRRWLNEDFYNVAFSKDEQEEINTTTYEVSDKVFILSNDDILNESLGFNVDKEFKDDARIKKGSDYAKCQGLGAVVSSEESNFGNSTWILRTPDDGSGYCKGVDYDGRVWIGCMVCGTDHGICPALALNDLSKFEKAEHIHSYNSVVAEKSDCAKEGTLKFTCLCGDTYTESIVKEPHEYKTESQKATTTKDGWYKVKCKNCGYVDSEGIYYSVKTIKLKTSKYTYDGKQKTPTVTVVDRMGNVIKKDGNYTVDFYEEERKLPGKYTVWFSFMESNYNCAKELEFSILPAKTSKITATQSTSSIKLTWKKVTGATGYRVYQYNSKTGKYEKIKTTTGTSYTVKNLKAGTTYKFAVKAYTKDSGETLWAASSKTVKTATKPATPSVRVTAGSKKATLSWNKVTGATGYVVYMMDEFGDYEKISSTKSTSFVKKSLKKGKTYKFRVRAYKKVDGKNIYSGYKTHSVKVK